MFTLHDLLSMTRRSWPLSPNILWRTVEPRKN